MIDYTEYYPDDLMPHMESPEASQDDEDDLPDPRLKPRQSGFLWSKLGAISQMGL